MNLCITKTKRQVPCNLFLILRCTCGSDGARATRGPPFSFPKLRLEEFEVEPWPSPQAATAQSSISSFQFRRFVELRGEKH